MQNPLRLTPPPEHDLARLKCCNKMESFKESMEMCHTSEKVPVEEEKPPTTEAIKEEPPRTTRKRREKAKNDKIVTNTKVKRTKIPPQTSPVVVPEKASEPPPTPPTFQCSECRESFRSKLALDSHLRQHYHNKTNERCAHCFATFKTPYELKVHTKMHVSNIVGGMKAAFQEMFDKNQENS